MSAPGRREVAHRVFAAEYDAADFEYSESDEERAPNYVVTPTGARVNRLFAVGVLTEVEQVGEEVLRARVVDPTGAFVVYAGQYQPDALAFLERADPPAFVAVTGKARTFSPDDADVIYTSVRPESINEVDAETRDRWTVRTAEHTLARVATFDAALDSGLTGEDLRSALEAAGAGPALAAGVPVAMDHYGTAEQYLASMADVARDALGLVAGDVEEIEVPDVAPDATGDRTVDRDRIAAATDLAVAEVEGGSEVGESDATTGGEEAAATTTDEPEPAGTTGEAAASTETEESDASTVTDEPGTVAATDEPDASTATDGPDAPTTTDESGTAMATDEPDASATSDEPESAGDAGSGAGADGPGDFEPATDEASETTAADDGPGDFDAGGEATGDSDASEEATGDSGEEVPEDVLDEEERERIESEYGTDFQTGTEVEDAGEAGIEPEAGPIEPEGSTEAAAGDEPEDATEAPATDESGGAPEAQAADEPADEPADDTAGGDLGDFDADGSEHSSTGVDDAEQTAAGSEPAAGDAPQESGGAGSETGADEATETGAHAASTAGESADAADESGEAPAEPDDVDLTEAVLDRMAELDDGDGADREALIADVVDRHGVAESDVADAIEDALMSGQCYEPADGKLSAI